MSLTETEIPGEDPQSLRRSWSDHRRLIKFLTRLGVILGLGWLVLVTVAAIFAPWIAPYDPDAQNLANTNAGISVSHWLGTDDLGRDVLSRLIYGARISMQITFETVAIALVLALIIGLVAGFRGGRTDYLLMRGADAGLAFPPLVLALAVVAVLGSGVNDVSLAFAIVFAPGFARFIRGQTLAIKEEAFVEASTSIGTPPTRIVLVRILPNVLTGLAVGIAIALGAALLTSSGLSFLGLGPPPPTASWGSMLEEAYNTALFTHPWSLVPSGLVIALTVLAFNTLGDAMRDTVSGVTTKAPRRPHPNPTWSHCGKPSIRSGALRRRSRRRGHQLCWRCGACASNSTPRTARRASWTRHRSTSGADRSSAWWASLGAGRP